MLLSLFNLNIISRDSFFQEPLPQAEPEVMVRPKVSKDPIGYIFENTDDGFFDAGEQKIEETNPIDHEPDEKRPYRLRPNALRVVLESFEEKITTEFTYPFTNEKVTYDEALILQAKQFRSVIEGNATRYQPLQLK